MYGTLGQMEAQLPYTFLALLGAKNLTPLYILKVTEASQATRYYVLPVINN